MTTISVFDLTVGEGEGVANVVVQLDAAASGPVSVQYATSDGTASRFSGGDFVATSGTLTFAPGETRKVVGIALQDGTTPESLEAFSLNLSAAVNATIARSKATISIIDNDSIVDTPELFVRDIVVDEKQGTAAFVVMLGNGAGRASNSTVTVNYATADGTAVAGSDYVTRSGTLSFAPGEVVKTVVVDLVDDSVAEALERFSLVLSNPLNARLGDGVALADIGANDATAQSQPRLTVGDVTVGEGDSYAELVVSLSAPGQNTVTVNYATQDVTASRFSGGDFIADSGTLSFAPGETTKVVRIQLQDGNTAEAYEDLRLVLSSPTNAAIARPEATISIIDNDNIVDTPELFVRDIVVDEKQGTAAFVVMLGNGAGRASNSTVTVNYATADGTAVAGSDYVTRSGTLSFAPGEVVKTVVVDLVDDSVAEALERFSLVLSNPLNARLGDGVALADIGANDATAQSQPRLTVGDVTVGEGDSYAELVVSLSAPGQNTVTVNYATQDVTASRFSGGDFIADSGTLSFAPGETTKVVRIQLQDGNTAEAYEDLRLVLSSPTNAAIARPEATISIIDNDNIVDTPELFVRDIVVDEKQGTAAFVVMLGNGAGRASNSTVTVNYATADGTAVAGSDYVARSGTLSFAPGEVVKTVVVDLVDDSVAEALERFSLVLSNPLNARLGDGVALADIGANDATAQSQPRLTVGDVTVGEGDSYAELVVSLSAPGQNTVTVNYATQDVTASRFSGGDFIADSGTLSFAPGETTKVVRIQLQDGITAESREAFHLVLSGAVNAALGRTHALVEVVDNDTVVETPGVFVRDAFVDEKQGTARFVVSLGARLGESSNAPVTVDFATVDGTALAGRDYLAAQGRLVFAPGESTKTVVVDLVDDALREGAERFGLQLSNAVGGRLVDASAVGLIGASDGTVAAQPTLDVAARTVSEADAAVTLVVRLSAPSTSTVTVNYATQDGTASRFSGGDFVGTSGSLSFAPGETLKSLRVELQDGIAVEPTESFSVILSSPVNARLGNSSALVTIIDDDTGGVAVLSQGDGDDVYRPADASALIVENADGGRDTVVVGWSVVLPADVENAVLTGNAVLSATGNAAANVLRGNSANNRLDGQGGIDTAVFDGPAAAFAVTPAAGGLTVSGGASGVDTLVSIERLQFTDQVRAFDTAPGGNTYAALALLWAAFDTAPGAALLGQWTSQLDQLGSARDLAQAMINFYAPGVSDEMLVAHLWGTIVETPISPADLSSFVGLLQDGSFTQASLLEFVSTYPLNTAEFVGLVGQPLEMDPSFFPVPPAG